MSLKKWHGSEKTDEEDLQNLIVFGYQCKLFRDDEKALFIDKGNHLIPWMGDSSLMIDRSVILVGTELIKKVSIYSHFI